MNLKDKRLSFYLMIAAAVLAVVGFSFYRTASVVEGNVQTIVIVGVVLTVAMVVLSMLRGKPRFLNLCATVIAIVLAWGFVQSVNMQLDPLGWWISGLYTYDQVKGYIFFAVLIAIAILLDVIASFIDLQK